MRARDGVPQPERFSILGGPVVPVLSCLIIVWLLFQLTAAEAIGLAILGASAIFIYAAGAKHRRRPDDLANARNGAGARLILDS